MGEFRADRCCCLENMKAPEKGWVLSVGSDCADLVPMEVTVPVLFQVRHVNLRVLLYESI